MGVDVAAGAWRGGVLLEPGAGLAGVSCNNAQMYYSES